MAWSRKTLWRQGHVLAQEDFQTANLTDTCDADLAVVISHSCDIASDRLDLEPDVEFILARRLEQLEQKDGRHTYWKNARTLHLGYEHRGNTVTLELIASKKRTVSKGLLEKIQPDLNYELISNRQVLQSWLAARYERHALPDSLVDRLDKVFDYIERKGKKNFSEILSFRLSYDPEEELPPEEHYNVNLTIIYVADRDEYRLVAEKLAKELLEGKFTELLGKVKEEKRGPVSLQSCKAVSEDNFTLREVRETVEYYAEHLSYRTDPPGPVI